MEKEHSFSTAFAWLVLKWKLKTLLFNMRPKQLLLPFGFLFFQCTFWAKLARSEAHAKLERKFPSQKTIDYAASMTNLTQTHRDIFNDIH